MCVFFYVRVSHIFVSENNFVKRNIHITKWHILIIYVIILCSFFFFFWTHAFSGFSLSSLLRNKLCLSVHKKRTRQYHAKVTHNFLDYRINNGMYTQWYVHTIVCTQFDGVCIKKNIFTLAL